MYQAQFANNVDKNIFTQASSLVRENKEKAGT